jgi:methylenetetrahydrofolate reductase (NADPH)
LDALIMCVLLFAKLKNHKDVPCGHEPSTYSILKCQAATHFCEWTRFFEVFSRREQYPRAGLLPIFRGMKRAGSSPASSPAVKRSFSPLLPAFGKNVLFSAGIMARCGHIVYAMRSISLPAGDFMRIIDKIAKGEQFISLEFFPPKEKQEWPAFFKTAGRLSQLDPLFASVTYGAGGSTKGDTLEIVSRLKKEYGLETMAHLTCVGAFGDELQLFLDNLAKAEIDNVLALRGDRPSDAAAEFSVCPTLLQASDLVAFIRKSHPDMGVGVAGYPETHPEAVGPEEDLGYLKLKLDQGGDFAITQLFFDNERYFDFLRRARAAGIDKPIIPGIIPVVSLKVIRRIISMCGAALPADFQAALEQADSSGGASAVQQLGVAWARRQCQELLAAGVPGVHIYTLNRDEAVLELVDGLLPS